MDVGSPAATRIIGRMAAQIAPACSQVTLRRWLRSAATGTKRLQHIHVFVIYIHVKNQICEQLFALLANNLQILNLCLQTAFDFNYGKGFFKYF